MTTLDAWRALRDERLPELPFDCGAGSNPGVRYNENLRDWSDKATTPDQMRIEQFIDRYDLRQKRVLHIGIGNSGLARRFHRRVKEIVGTTIDEPEMAVARSLALPNYRFVIHNKYSGLDGVVEGTFDFILDNNPTSPCCCIRHLAKLFDFYAAKLAPDGQVVTDRIGLRWVPNETNPRWSFDFDDLTAVAGLAGFETFRPTPMIYVMARNAPSAPGTASELRHWMRRARTLPRGAARWSLRETLRITPKWIKDRLSTVLRRNEGRRR